MNISSKIKILVVFYLFLNHIDTERMLLWVSNRQEATAQTVEHAVFSLIFAIKNII